MSERPLDLQKSYLLKQTTQMQRIEIESLLHRTNLDSLKPEPCETLELNDIGTVRVHCHRPLYFDAYRENRRTGAFVLIDSLGNGTVAAGMIIGTAGGSASSSLTEGRGHSMVSPREREERLGQRGVVLLLSGLPGSGKTELAYSIERLLHDQGRLALVVDPTDALSLGNAEQQRQPEELSASVLEVARRAADLGLIVLLPFAAPRLSSRERWRAAIGDERWLEVGLTTPLETCKDRTANDFYARVRAPSHDPSRAPAATVDGSDGEAAARVVVSMLEQRGIVQQR